MTAATPIKHHCPACGSFMGFTHTRDDAVFCSWGDDDTSPCARYGYAFHPDCAKPFAAPRGPRGRRWQLGDSDETQ